MQKIVVTIIQFYQRWISPVFPPHCRYTPTCSQYIIDAVKYYGVWKGLRLGMRRLLSCHPFHAGGFDPVPEPSDRK